MIKLRKAATDFNINQVAVAGGGFSKSALRQAFNDHASKLGWKVYIPPFSFTTDNAAMIAVTGYFKFLNNDFCSMSEVPFARVTNTF